VHHSTIISDREIKRLNHTKDLYSWQEVDRTAAEMFPKTSHTWARRRCQPVRPTSAVVVSSWPRWWSTRDPWEGVKSRDSYPFPSLGDACADSTLQRSIIRALRHKSTGDVHTVATVDTMTQKTAAII